MKIDSSQMKNAEVGRIAAPDKLQRDARRHTHAPGQTMSAKRLKIREPLLGTESGLTSRS